MDQSRLRMDRSILRMDRSRLRTYRSRLRLDRSRLRMDRSRLRMDRSGSLVDRSSMYFFRGGFLPESFQDEQKKNIYIYERADLHGKTKIRAGAQCAIPSQWSSKWISFYRSASAWIREGESAHPVKYNKKSASKCSSEMGRQFATKMVQVEQFSWGHSSPHNPSSSIVIHCIHLNPS
jgi:hypothetical protein